MNQGPLAGMLPTRDSLGQAEPAVREKAFERPFHGW